MLGRASLYMSTCAFIRGICAYAISTTFSRAGPYYVHGSTLVTKRDIAYNNIVIRAQYAAKHTAAAIFQKRNVSQYHLTSAKNAFQSYNHAL